MVLLLPRCRNFWEEETFPAAAEETFSTFTQEFWPKVSQFLPSLCFPFSKEWIPAENNIYRTRSLKGLFKKILELGEPMMNLQLLTAFCAHKLS
jgi:hypothetical protein